MRISSLLLISIWALSLFMPRPSAPKSLHQTFTVTTTSDDYDGSCSVVHCSLRDAVQSANLTPGLDTILFSQAGIYQLSRAGANEDSNLTGDLDIRDDLILRADDLAGSVVIDGGTLDRAITITATAEVTISTITVQGGIAPATDPVGGGGILVYNSSLYLDKSVVQSNSAPQGGGITNSLGQLIISESTISGNSTSGSVVGVGEGGGIFSDGSLKVYSSTIANNTARRGGGVSGTEFADMYLAEVTFSGNQASGDGGAIFNDKTIQLYDSTLTQNQAERGAGVYSFGDANIFRTTFHNNTASQGGAISMSAANIDLENVTLSANQATSQGGAIFGSGYLSTRNVTFSDNSAPAGASIYLTEGGNTNLSNTLVVGPAGNNCAGATEEILSQGYNLETGDTCQMHTSGDLVNIANPGILPLDFNLGKTKTHALQAGSPAIDKGDSVGCASTDQRMILRPVDGDSNGTGICDIGAFEFYNKGLLAFQPKVYVQEEPGSGTAQVTIIVVRLSGVQYTEVSYASEQSLDIIPVYGILRWPPGDTFPKSFEVSVVADQWQEADQTILLRLMLPKYGVAILAGDEIASLTIPANDPLGPPKPSLFPNFQFLPLLRR